MAVGGLSWTVPPSGARAPASAASSVDLPAPLGPTTPVREPGATVSETSDSTSTGPRTTVRPDATRVADTARDATGADPQAPSTWARSKRTGRSSWANVHEVGSRSGRQWRNCAVCRKRLPSIAS